ncbi:nucleolar protein 56 [Nematocida major]|uniref:nucleolar protein 56 n=1 Tax=Nematocida major TaxID=1912982 RepID=UPI0020073DBF|nr:nucleolar protein 56 [Nematocida major]KAH9386836.1 nucleolar protein 56 [Nematocida major]
MVHILYEHPVGYLLVEAKELDTVSTKATLASVKTLGDFKKVFQISGTLVHADPQDALEQIEAASEGKISPKLQEFLHINGVSVLAADKAYSLAIKDLGIKMYNEESTHELMRAVRKHADAIFGVDTQKVGKSQISLAHALSRKKVQYDAAREDHAVMQCISMLDDTSVDINDYFMRIREVYAWHFPELSELCTGQAEYLQAIRVIGDRETASQNEVAQLSNGEEIAKAMHNTIGGEIGQEDLQVIAELSSVVEEKMALYAHAMEHLEKRLETVAPNLTALVGKVVAARLILKAGGLSKLALCPASTIQVLGAEKALFRAMKSKAQTPKYGLIFHSSFVGAAVPRMRGRVSRYLSAKCAIASRIDCYAEDVTDAYGLAMRTMVEERAKGRSTHHMPTDAVLQKVAEDIAAQKGAAL